MAGDGSLLGAYMTTGGAVSVNHSGVGVYQVHFAGEQVDDGYALIATAAVSGYSCAARATSFRVYVLCAGANGNAGNIPFPLVVFNDD